MTIKLLDVENNEVNEPDNRSQNEYCANESNENPFQHDFDSHLLTSTFPPFLSGFIQFFQAGQIELSKNKRLLYEKST
tara:strand:- start:877 stop:1110 length:234 start_codon:yes stop_codon:yes gene_type:complete